MIPLDQHRKEIERNRRSWQTKPLLHQIYARFYERILTLVDPALPGRVVEIGSGIGNLKTHWARAVTTDLFASPWLDLVCDGYELPFCDGSVSHLVLFDVFHHLRAPKAFLDEARRVLGPDGRLILFEPYISLASFPVYGWLHHEPVAWRERIDLSGEAPRRRDYYAAQGNATRLFFKNAPSDWLSDWRLFHREAFGAFSYLLSGGYSKPALYPNCCLGFLLKLDAALSRLPSLFGARCLVGLKPGS
jgi:SAM-dependent methyltransferase